MLWGKEEPTITREPGSHVRRQGPWKPISVPNRFGINGKEKPPSNGKLHIKFLPLPSIIDITLARIYDIPAFYSKS